MNLTGARARIRKDRKNDILQAEYASTPNVFLQAITAEELASLDLRGTALLTLSACETALGETMRGQGISGLRMASQVAGVRAMLISLWKVDDLGTQLFMQVFYCRLWKENKGRLAALQETRREWISQERQGARGPNGEDLYTPRIWAAFILSGEK